MENSVLQTELTNLLKERISLSKSTRSNYARGEDTYDPVLSQAVVFPETNEEVSKILKMSVWRYSGERIPKPYFLSGSIFWSFLYLMGRYPKK